MARKTSSRLQKRREVEAAGTDTAADGKKTAKRKPAKRASRAKDKPSQRKRLVWTVLSGSMKEEARFPYDQRAAAEEKIEQLRSKSKKLYFIQPVKELITDAPASPEKAPAEKAPATKAASRKAAAGKESAAGDEEE